MDHSESRRKVSLNEAIASGTTEFMRRQPPETWPSWLDAHLSAGAMPVDSGWLFQCTLPFREPLQEGESWEIVQGHKVVVSVDPRTGIRNVVIHRRATRPPMVLFEAEISATTGELSVTKEVDAATLQATDFLDADH